MAKARWTAADVERVQRRNGQSGVTVSTNVEKPKKAPKYRNTKVIYDGFSFDSIKEGKRYLQLRQMMDMGLIKFLNMQVKFQLSVCAYIADFVYFDRGEVICEDVKSSATRKLPAYRLKCKMMKHELGITITEI